MLHTAERQKIIAERHNKCECCGNTTWLNQPIKLEIHHIDGNRLNDNPENLQVLCPNCHSYTENHSRNINHHNVSDDELVQFLKKAPTIHSALLNAKLSTSGANYQRARKLIKKYNITHLFQTPQIKEQNYCIDCGAPIEKNAIRCSKCNHIHSRTVERPNREELKSLIRTTPFTTIAKQYNVSDNAIRKWCKNYDLPHRIKDIKLYNDIEWEEI